MKGRTSEQRKKVKGVAMDIKLALWAWKFLLDYHGYEAELEIVNEEEGEKEND